MEQFIQFLPVIVLIGAVLLFLKYKKPKTTPMFSNVSETDKSYEDKMLLLLAESNKRLKGIDTTLDWFFWIMILGGVLFIVSFFLAL